MRGGATSPFFFQTLPLSIVISVDVVMMIQEAERRETTFREIFIDDTLCLVPLTKYARQLLVLGRHFADFILSTCEEQNSLDLFHPPLSLPP